MPKPCGKGGSRPEADDPSDACFHFEVESGTDFPTSVRDLNCDSNPIKKSAPG